MKNKLILILIFILVVCFAYSGFKYYNRSDTKFSRYLNKITSINRSEVIVIDVILRKDNVIFKSSFNNEEAFLMLDLLHELKYLKGKPLLDKDFDYCYAVWNSIETSESIYSIELEINQVNYNIRIIQIDLDMNGNKKIKTTKYFTANEKSIALIKELLN